MIEADSIRLDDSVKHALTRRSDWRGLSQLGAHLLLLSGAAVLMSSAPQGIAWLLATLVYGAVLTFLFAPLHETIHHTAFASRWLNNAVAAPIGFLLLIPYRYFRAFHYAHHRDTQNPERDPELAGVPALTRAGYWWRISGLPFWWDNARRIYRHALGRVDESFIPASKKAAIVTEARLHVAGYALLLSYSLIESSSLLWDYWILPALLAQPFLRLFLMAEHGGCDVGDNMLENSRTTYTSPWLLFLGWNMSYHAEHHYLPSVPFHALPALHAHTGQRIKHRGDGYFRVNRELYSRL